EQLYVGHAELVQTDAGAVRRPSHLDRDPELALFGAHTGHVDETVHLHAGVTMGVHHVERITRVVEVVEIRTRAHEGLHLEHALRFELRKAREGWRPERARIAGCRLLEVGEDEAEVLPGRVARDAHFGGE